MVSNPLGHPLSNTPPSQKMSNPDSSKPLEHPQPNTQPAQRIIDQDLSDGTYFEDEGSIESLVSCLRVIETHPKTAVGWWCAHTKHMSSLLPFLSDPTICSRQLWSEFRSEVSSQIATCRQCAVHYHAAVSAWEISDAFGSYLLPFARKRLQSLISWDCDRIYPVLKRASQIPSSADDVVAKGIQIQSREACIEALLGLRICMETKIIDVLSSVFTQRNPIDSSEDFKTLLDEIGFLPPGLTVLCFHRSQLVRSWAIRTFNRFSKEFYVQVEPVQYFLTKVLRFLRQRAGLEPPNGSSPFVQLSLHGMLLGLCTILQTLPDTVCEDLVSCKPGSAMQTFAEILSQNEQSIVLCTCDCIEALILRVPFEVLFSSALMSLDGLLDALFKSLSNVRQNQEVQKRLLDLLEEVIIQAKNRLSKDSVVAVHCKCFNFFESTCENLADSLLPSFVDGRETNNLNNDRIRYRHFLSTGARLLNWHFALSAPYAPVTKSDCISKFICAVLREDPGNAVGWNVLRTALVLDVLNIVRCVLGRAEADLIAKTFLLRPAFIALGDDEKNVLSDVVGLSRSAPRVLTFNCSLWDVLRKSRHLLPSQNSSSSTTHEARLFLDLHRLVGNIDPCSVGIHLPSTKLDSIVWSEVYGMSADRRKYVQDNLDMIQGIVINRLHFFMKNSKEKQWFSELPFHATHLLSSTNKELVAVTTQDLLNMFDLQSATIDGSKMKMVGHALKNDPLHVESVSIGFFSASRMVYSWGSSISLDSFSRHFLWHRALLDLGFGEWLISQGSSEWVVGVMVVFLCSWRRFETNNKIDAFREACCRFLSNLREIWEDWIDSSSAHIKCEGEQGRICKWVCQVESGLLGMHELRDPLPRASWVTTICKLAPFLSKREVLCEKVQDLIVEHARDRTRLTFQQCEALASAMKLYDIDVLSKWGKEEQRAKLQKQKAATQTQTTLADMDIKKLQNKKLLRATRIEDHFSPASRGASSSTGGNAALSVGRGVTCNPGPKCDPRNDLKVSKTIQKPPRSFRAPLSRNTNSSRHPVSSCSSELSKIAELRRIHSAASAETRKLTPVEVQTSDTQPEERAKTKFELQREQFKKEYDKKRLERKLALDADNNKTLCKAKDDIRKREVNEKTVRKSAAENSQRVEEHQEDFHVPTRRRFLDCISLERVYQTILQKYSSFERANEEHKYSSQLFRKSFSTVNSYVKYWEPLLIEEFRASLDNAMMEETAYFEKHGQPCRTEFMVENLVESIGYQQIINICYDVKQRLNERRNNDGEEFDPLRARTHDILMLDCPSPYLDSKGQPAPRVLTKALVLGVSFERGQISLKLSTAFNSLDQSPGKGRLVRVSRIASLTTFERQVEALRELVNIPDGWLWPVLEPIFGWKMNQGAAARVESACDAMLSPPCQFIEKMRSANQLNSSQAAAIKSVVRSCGPLFKPRGTSSGPFGNHGGISLIQGPPGTGKTSTVIALLATLLFANPTNTRVRRAAVDFDGHRHIVLLPPIRILVCAPSNAAVDEIMTRVIDQGLLHPSGGKACPRLVRIGGGSTLEALRAFELRKLAKCDEAVSPFDEAIQASEAKKREHLGDSRKVNDQIHIVDKEQKMLRQRLQELRDKDEKGNVKREVENQLNEVSTKLKTLHVSKTQIHDAITQDRTSAKEAEGMKRKENDVKMAEILNGAAIVFATLNSSGHEVMHRFGARFDIVIVDEAAQCVEPDIIIPMTAGRRSKSANQGFSHLVLVGDQKQLPATVLSENRAVSAPLGCSMFERFSTCSPNAVHMLDTQYRMHPKISCFPCQQFYSGRLKDGESVLSKTMCQPYHEDSTRRFGPLTFIDTAAVLFKENHSSRGSIHNFEEARLILSAITALIRKYPIYNFTGKIAVLSPYREQVVFLKRILKENFATRQAEVEVNTIDGIQGREKSIIFLSTVRGHNARTIGFVRDERRMNVALTRAKHSSIIVGNAIVLSEHSEAWATLIQKCRNEQVLLEVPSSKAMFPESRDYKMKSVDNKVQKQAKTGEKKNKGHPMDTESRSLNVIPIRKRERAGESPSRGNREKHRRMNKDTCARRDKVDVGGFRSAKPNFGGAVDASTLSKDLEKGCNQPPQQRQVLLKDGPNNFKSDLAGNRSDDGLNPSRLQETRSVNDNASEKPMTGYPVMKKNVSSKTGAPSLGLGLRSAPVGEIAIKDRTEVKQHDSNQGSVIRHEKNKDVKIPCTSHILGSSTLKTQVPVSREYLPQRSGDSQPRQLSGMSEPSGRLVPTSHRVPNMNQNLLPNLPQPSQGHLEPLINGSLTPSTFSSVVSSQRIAVQDDRTMVAETQSIVKPSLKGPFQPNCRQYAEDFGNAEYLEQMSGYISGPGCALPESTAKLERINEVRNSEGYPSLPQNSSQVRSRLNIETVKQLAPDWHDNRQVASLQHQQQTVQAGIGDLQRFQLQTNGYHGGERIRVHKDNFVNQNHFYPGHFPDERTARNWSTAVDRGLIEERVNINYDAVGPLRPDYDLRNVLSQNYTTDQFQCDAGPRGSGLDNNAVYQVEAFRDRERRCSNRPDIERGILPSRHESAHFAGNGPHSRYKVGPTGSGSQSKAEDFHCSGSSNQQWNYMSRNGRHGDPAASNYFGNSQNPNNQFAPRNNSEWDRPRQNQGYRGRGRAFNQRGNRRKRARCDERRAPDKGLGNQWLGLRGGRPWNDDRGPMNSHSRNQQRDGYSLRNDQTHERRRIQKAKNSQGRPQNTGGGGGFSLADMSRNLQRTQETARRAQE